MAYDYDDDEGRPRWFIPLVVVIIAGLAIGILLWARDDDSNAATTPTLPSTVPLPPVTADRAAATPGTIPAPAQPPTSTAPSPVTTAAPPEATDTTVATPDTTGTVSSVVTQVPGIPTYPTLPDGSPQPVLAVFSPNLVTVSGLVPSDAAKQTLISLALANSRDPANTTVNADFLTVDATVPIDIGVRVIETTSTRFDSGKSNVVPGSPHAQELDRIGVVMKAFPKVTALIIGHADPRGSDESNYKLSAARAQAVVDYLVSTGVDASRLSSRAVGEADLLTLNSDETALALNRRTEFTLYGLLLP